MTMQWGVAGRFPAIYEEIMVPAFFRAFAEDLVSRVAPRPGERLLDVATGTGIVVRVALEHEPGLARPVGLDRTPGMLQAARDAGGGLDVAWQEGDALELPFGDGSFDLVTCQQGLQFFPDRDRAVAEMRRVLAPGGRVAIACWTGLGDQVLHRELERVVRDAEPDLAPVALAPFAFGDPDALRALLGAAGFEDVQLARVELPARFASPDAFYRSFAEGSPFALALEGIPEERVAALREATIRAAEPLAGPDGLEGAMVTSVAIARTPAGSA